MSDTVQKTTRLISAALFRYGRMAIAPPSGEASCWRVFAAGLNAEVREHRDLSLCFYTLKGPDGKILRQGVAPDLLSGLRQAAGLLHQLSDHEAAA
jgi:hypothetical protein